MKSQASHQKKYQIKGTIKRNQTTSGLYNKSIVKVSPKSVPKPIDLPSQHREKEKSHTDRNAINKSSSWSNYTSESTSLLKQESQNQLTNQQGQTTKSQWNTERANEITPKENSSIYTRKEESTIELNGSDFPTLEKSIKVTKSSTISSNSNNNSSKSDMKDLLNNRYHWADEDEDVDVDVTSDNEKKAHVVEETVKINNSNSETNVKYNISKRDIHYSEKRTTSYSDSRRKSNYFESRRQQTQQQNFPSVTNRPRILTSNNHQTESDSSISIEEYEKRIKETMTKKALEKRKEIEEKLRKEEEERMARAKAKLEELDRRKEQERLEKERQERERQEKERQERERLEKEREEKERQERERIEKERQEKERQEKERLEKEKAEQIRKQKEQQESEKKFERGEQTFHSKTTNDRREKFQSNGYNTYKRGGKKQWDYKNVQKQPRNDSWNKNNQYKKEETIAKDTSNKFRGGKYDNSGSLKYNKQQYNKYSQNDKYNYTYNNMKNNKLGNKSTQKNNSHQKDVIYKKDEASKLPSQPKESANVTQKEIQKPEVQTSNINTTNNHTSEKNDQKTANKAEYTNIKKPIQENQSNKEYRNKNTYYKNTLNNTQPKKSNKKTYQPTSSKPKKMVYVKLTDLQ